MCYFSKRSGNQRPGLFPFNTLALPDGLLFNNISAPAAEIPTAAVLNA
jgi:hypothetical protein